LNTLVSKRAKSAFRLAAQQCVGRVMRQHRGLIKSCEILKKYIIRPPVVNVRAGIKEITLG